jgi:hypothetical protein
VDAAERTRLVREGVARASSRLDRIEERVGGLDLLASEVAELAERIERLEEAAWLPDERTLRARRYRAIIEQRREGWSVSAIAASVGMSRSRVAAIVRDVPPPAVVRTVAGRTFPARAMVDHKRRAAGANGARP